MKKILALNNITKFYGKIRALDHVSFEVPEGSVFGILGPNGSGKTTLLGIVTDVLKATSGKYSWFGETPSEKQRRQLGTLLETPNFYHYLSGDREICKSLPLSKRKDADDIPRVLDLVRLTERKTFPFQYLFIGDETKTCHRFLPAG